MRSPVMGELIPRLYEYRKGVRQLFMMTMTAQEADAVVGRLAGESIAHHAQPVNPRKVNVFFGRPPCVEVVRRMVTKPLCRLTPEEDFILGTLLGYDREQQCLRFLSMSRGGKGGVSVA
jgi:hypothetical protein